MDMTSCVDRLALIKKTNDRKALAAGFLNEALNCLRYSHIDPVFNGDICKLHGLIEDAMVMLDLKITSI